MKKFILLLILSIVFIPRVSADSLELDAKSAILIDNASGKVLYEKNVDEKMPIASMTKVMSMLLIMENISEGNLNYNDKVIISKNASSMGGSQVFLQVGEEYKLEDLLKCIAVSSANDAVVAVAEKIGGSEEEFVNMMNKKALELGMKNTNFANPHGLDDENHYSTARDMAILARELLKHEDIIRFTSIYEDYLTKPDGSQVWLVNTNRLVRFYDGVDGLKTGYTTEAGYCLTATAKKNDLRLISVVMNASSADNRSKDTVSLLTYGYNNYKNSVVYSKDKEIGEVKVLNGKKDKISIYLKKDATVIIPVTEKVGNYSIDIKVNEVEAPVKKNTVIGKADIIDSNGNIISEVDITVKEDVLKANFWDYLKFNFKVITGGM